MIKINTPLQQSQFIKGVKMADKTILNSLFSKYETQINSLEETNEVPRSV